MVQVEEKVDRRVLKTRKAILAAFDKMISKGDLSKITVSAIAREANIDRKTFYLHFSSVDDLTHMKTEQGVERVLRALESKGADLSISEQLHIILQEVNAIIMEDTIAYANIATHLSTEQLLDYLERAIVSVFERSNINMEIDGSYRFYLCCKFYRAGAWALYSDWLKSDRTRPIEEVSDAIEDAIGSSLEWYSLALQ